MDEHHNIFALDNGLPLDLQHRLAEFVQQPIWRYGWRSNNQQDRYCFCHAHFAGGDGNSRVDCSEELLRNEAAARSRRYGDICPLAF